MHDFPGISGHLQGQKCFCLVFSFITPEIEPDRFIASVIEDSTPGALNAAYAKPFFHEKQHVLSEKASFSAFMLSASSSSMVEILLKPPTRLK